MADSPTAAVVNEAIQMMGGNEGAGVTGNAPNFDNSAAGIAAKYLYTPCVEFVARTWEWDFARAYVDLTASGNTAPDNWDFEYLYPEDAVQVWQVKPKTVADANDPLPTTWVRGNAQVGGVQTAVLWTDVANAQAIFNNNPTPGIWDAGFRMAVVRLLSGEMAIALAGRPDTSQVLTTSAAMMAEIAKARDS